MIDKGILKDSLKFGSVVEKKRYLRPKVLLLEKYFVNEYQKMIKQRKKEAKPEP